MDDIHSNGSISDKCADYLKIINPRVPAFYTLPKFHKKVNPPPGRPILSANEVPNERISEFVDHFLQPYLVEMKSYVKDTTGFVKDIKSLRKIPKNAFLVSLDIVSLYTNIPHHEGLVTIRRLLNTKRFSTLKPRNQDLVRMLALVLSLNHFEFNKTFWTQKGGLQWVVNAAPQYPIFS